MKFDDRKKTLDHWLAQATTVDLFVELKRRGYPEDLLTELANSPTGKTVDWSNIDEEQR